MKFYEYQTDHSLCKKILNYSLPVDQFYKESLKNIKPNQVDPFSPAKLDIEYNWILDKKPYYNIYPSIIPHLLKINLNKVEVDQINLPLPYLLMRFPEKNDINFNFKDKKYYLRSLLVADNYYFRVDSNQMVFFIDFGEYDEFGWSVKTFKNLKKKSGLNVFEGLNALKAHESFDIGVVCPQDFIENCAKLICTICLMTGDSDIISPEVLSCDQEKFEKTKDAKYIDKSIRRGKYGWSVGKNLQISPHFRSHCPAALYWTGPKKTVPKIRFRKGCIVHKKTVTSIPSGFLGENE